MTKQDFGVLCDKYQVNKRALKQVLKKHGFKRKHALKREVLECLYLHAPDLFWTRDIGDDGVEYLDKNIIVELIRETNEEGDNEVSQLKEIFGSMSWDNGDNYAREYYARPFSCDKGVSK